MREAMTNPICGPPAGESRRENAVRRRRKRSLPALLLVLPLAALLALPSASPIGASWVDFVDDTATRLVAAPANGVDDAEEKSFAWGDLDRDGDIDLIVARKQPWSTPGKRSNVLLINESGVLTERTADFATDSNTRPAKFYRRMNEVPTVLMIGIVIFVVVKPF